MGPQHSIYSGDYWWWLLTTFLKCWRFFLWHFLTASTSCSRHFVVVPTTLCQNFKTSKRMGALLWVLWTLFSNTAQNFLLNIFLYFGPITNYNFCIYNIMLEIKQKLWMSKCIGWCEFNIRFFTSNNKHTGFIIVIYTC